MKTEVSEAIGADYNKVSIPYLTMWCDEDSIPSYVLILMMLLRPSIIILHSLLHWL